MTLVKKPILQWEQDAFCRQWNCYWKADGRVPGDAGNTLTTIYDDPLKKQTGEFLL